MCQHDHMICCLPITLERQGYAEFVVENVVCLYFWCSLRMKIFQHFIYGAVTTQKMCSCCQAHLL